MVGFFVWSSRIEMLQNARYWVLRRVPSQKRRGRTVCDVIIFSEEWRLNLTLLNFYRNLALILNLEIIENLWLHVWPEEKKS